MIKQKLNKILIAVTSCDLNGGGIQHVNSDFIDALQQSNLFVTKIIILNDTFRFGCKLNSKCFKKNKFLFALEFLTSCIFFRPNIIILGHLAFLPIGIISRVLFNKNVWCWLYGTEAWEATKFNRILLKFINQYISISYFTRDKFINIYPNANIKVCHLSIKNTQFNNLNYTNKDNIPIKPFILTVGRMVSSETGKGTEELIKAMSFIKEIMPELKLYIVGEGDKRKSLEELTKYHNLTDNVVFTGFLQKEVLESFYEDCTLFAMPSRQEGFGIVYLEAMAHKKPCIASNIDAGQEIVLNKVTGYTVNPDSDEELINAIIKIVNNDNECKNFGTEGYNRLITHFSYKAFLKRVCEYFT